METIGISWLKTKIRGYMRRRKTYEIARAVSENLNVNGFVVMSEESFYDVSQVREVVELLSAGTASVRANVFRSQVVFHMES
jgi:hypothetical protein